ncbi:MAG: Imidazole glycerol phosphate synthase subunit HisH 1 [candidate division CPR1 bacterium ADurb.Bin160]|uniref:Imidazole glycerol phosphate synthase subunit HisH n=1 Tax=candidate division CPR1 bacterium ADurb.Bin160 TaxID=1852826 RepID=A0A1V5ZIJ9_9BACT|nr:MAG: Imidazole glycerol phosphate synthase subunit HisH 1 [candidate division CPR1 bacterium ADurb.Bin160]
MIAIIDYGMGNLPNVKRALEKFTKDVIITENIEEITKADKLILPGVGAFGDAMRNIDKLGLREIIKKEAQEKPLLGICLGMQLLFEKSEEDKEEKGLGIIEGEVLRFSNEIKLKIPEMGWNSVKKTKESKILKNIDDNSYFYFVHSYYVKPKDKEVTAGNTYYGLDFTSVVEKDNIMAAQFHPEKSHEIGLKILENFVKI